jgi:hypothetical protein
MSTHPSAPQDFATIRVRGGQAHQHHEHWNPLWLLSMLACLSIFALGLLSHWLVNRDAAPAAASASALATAADGGGPDTGRAELSAPVPPQDAVEPPPLTSLDFDRWDEYEQKSLDGLFDNELPLHAHNSVDDHVFLALLEHDIKPAKLCSDATFLRRVYIDTIGTLPTAQEARQFLDDRDERKRAQLVEQLLERPEFADYNAMRWCDLLRVKAEFPINLWPNAAQAYHRWIRTAIKNDLPYDQFARQLLTSSGSNFRAPQVNFYRAMQSKEAKAIAQTVALTFMGERAERWPAARLEGMGQFFSKVGYKPTGEWKEEIVFYDPRAGDPAAVNQPVRAIYPSGATVEIPAGQDPREVFANWLIHEKNPWFARVIANRVWYWLLGQGIVDPPDDVRPDNPASNLPLLNHLAEELVAADYQLKHLYRLILNSGAYQLSCVPASDDPQATRLFARYPTQRLDAEVLIDAICQITGTTETYMSIIPEPFTFLPDHQRAISLPDGSITSSFLEMFGRPPRDTGMASERNNRLTAAQALHLLNSNHIRNKLEGGPAIGELLSQASDSAAKAELIYLTILSRRPTADELDGAIQLCDDGGGTRDLIWALINSDEFLFRH